MRLVKLLIIFALSSCSTNPPEGIGLSDNLETVKSFEGICLKNQDDFDNITRMLDSAKDFSKVKIKKLDQNMIDSDPALNSLGGKGYIYEDDKIKILIGFANAGGCSISAISENINGLSEILLQNYKIHQVSENKEGMQFTLIFKFNEDSSYSGSLVFLTYAKDKNEYLFTLSLLPKRNIPKE